MTNYLGFGLGRDPWQSAFSEINELLRGADRNRPIQACLNAYGTVAQEWLVVPKSCLAIWFPATDYSPLRRQGLQENNDITTNGAQNQHAKAMFRELQLR